LRLAAGFPFCPPAPTRETLVATLTDHRAGINQLTFDRPKIKNCPEE